METHKYFFFCFIVISANCFSQGIWTQKASLPSIERYDAMSFSMDMKGYIIGGANSSATQIQNDVWEYDAVNNSWLQKQDFPTTRWMGKTFSIGTNGYLLTGAPGFYNDFWEYNPLNDVWSQKANLPTVGRYAAFAFSIGNKGYVGAGQTSNSKVDDFWEYDKTSNLWTQKTNVPGGKRSFTVGFSIVSKGYIGTGIDSSNILLDDFWEYNPALDSWEQKANYPGGKRKDIDGAHFTIDNFVYMGTGWYQPSSTYYNDFWKYDPSNDIWEQIPNFPAAARMGMSGFSINGKGYIGLGVVINSTAFDDLWEYTPDSIKDGTVKLKSEKDIILYQNEPNPFGENTVIRFYVPEGLTQKTFIAFYDSYGKEINRVRIQQTGYGKINADTQNLTGGVYSYSIIVNDVVKDTKKMIKQ